ncbi:helix-turn-helix domain-containing protein [Devosia sp. RR2S18]|uniref:helix-turn-helix domain-containing protein n=1 Tax=Devosia rhizosphaerae TaxID=3049774 RepID=UPI00254266B4|nr:helix-turn-helix transcriptional regulator [Devosia sp. RR2S18]WIJ24037.1 helix-turn-helix transcriptional regulator [Devosia sp. RR2S18]
MLAKTQAQGSETTELRQAAGLWLKECREAAGISQRELAKTLHLDYYTFISQLENGRGRIPPNRYRDWAAALQIDEKSFAKRLLMYYDPVTYEILFSDTVTDAAV